MVPIVQIVAGFRKKLKKFLYLYRHIPCSYICTKIVLEEDRNCTDEMYQLFDGLMDIVK